MGPASPVRVTAVRSASENRAFWTLPYRLYRHCSHWPAPLRRDERRRWDPAANPALAGRTIRRLVAWRGSTPVGRIVAFVDPAFAVRWGAATGGFGFFEAVDDAEVARALLDAAERALRAEGVARVLGPINLSFHDEMGLLADGFEAPPALLTPFNPAYYVRLIEGCGYRPVFDQHAYRWSAGRALHPAVARAARRAASQGVTVRPLRPAQWEHEVRLLHALYNAAFAEVWGFVPISWEDFHARAREFRGWYRPELVLIAEAGKQAVGFALALPELSPLLARVRGWLWPFGAPYLALRKGRLPEARLMLLGVLPEFTARGIAACLAAEMAAAAVRIGLTGGELSLVHESNRAIRHVIEACGGVRTKTFRVYGRVMASVTASPSG
jgi:GNAT superfamily N-acetyltransferase